MGKKPEVVLTVGHSDRSLEDFLHLLRSHDVTLVADVRKMPRSRHNPQFNSDSLPKELAKVGVGYQVFPGLGGLRKAQADSVNTGWRHRSFRAYADYMQTPAFAEALEELIERARSQRVAIMCAEAVPWRCHRSLIGDALLVHGIGVEDIYSAERRRPHVLTSFAKVDGIRITYPEPAGDEAAGELFRQ
jgi:uncharacterized protein (DUF488 family)